MSTDETSPQSDPELERSPEEKLKALLRRDNISEESRRVARRSLARRQEDSL
jgi:hypothetical protein